MGLSLKLVSKQQKCRCHLETQKLVIPLELVQQELGVQHSLKAPNPMLSQVQYTGQTKVAFLEVEAFTTAPLPHRKSCAMRPTQACAANFGPGKPFVAVSFKECEN